MWPKLIAWSQPSDDAPLGMTKLPRITASSMCIFPAELVSYILCYMNHQDIIQWWTVSLCSICWIMNVSHQVYTVPLPYRFKSGSTLSLTIPRFGRFCMWTHPSFILLDHFPLNLLPLSSTCSCSQHSWHSHGPQSVYCYSSLTPSWYLSLFLSTPYSLALRYVFLRLDTYSYSFEFIELFFRWTLTRAVPLTLLPDGMIPIDSAMLTLIMDSLLFCPILSYRTRIPYYSSVLPCSKKFYAYASLSISR